VQKSIDVIFVRMSEKVGFVTISNYEVYLKGMRRGLYDKLFFIDKVGTDIQTIVDFGSADGYLSDIMANIFDCKVYGYDIDPKMIEIAKQNYTNPNLIFTDSFTDVPEQVDIIYASSLLHEVYSYGSPDSIEKFWVQLFEKSPRYVVIRDMIGDATMDRPSDRDDVRKVYRWAKEKHRERYLKEFELKVGSISNNKNLIHFLLKHSYIDNWDREVRENYFPITLQDLYASISNDYDILYEDHNNIVHLTQIWEKEFDIDVKDKTHIKLILKRCKN
jgi:SAM-dependent methyltransferase